MLNIENGVFAIKFGADWCAPCKVVDKILEKMSSEFPTVTIKHVNVDDSPEIAKQYKIRNLPTVIFTVDGQEVERVLGAAKTDPFRKIFRDLSKNTEAA